MPSGMPRAETALRRINEAVKNEKNEAEVVRIATHFLNHDRPEVREAVGLALMNAPHKSAAPYIERGLSDKNSEVIEAFVRAAAENKLTGFSNKIGRIFRGTSPFERDFRFVLAQALGELGCRKEHLNYLVAENEDQKEVRGAIKEARGRILARLTEARVNETPAVKRIVKPRMNDETHRKVLKLIGSGGLRHADPSVRSKAAERIVELAGGADASHPLNRALKWLNLEKHPREFGDLYRKGTNADFNWRILDWYSAARVLKRDGSLPKKR